MSALGTGGSQVLECLIANIRCIGSLDISDNGQSVADGFVFTYLLTYLIVLWHSDCVLCVGPGAVSKWLSVYVSK